MAELRFSQEWLSAGNDDPETRDTTALLGIHVDDICLTRNEDLWSRTVRDTVLVSAYPLALWFASSWWRLNWEPLPRPGIRPTLDWRMAHELGAANHGFVWPRILFASEGEAINIWAAAENTAGQSVTYLGNLDGPRSVGRIDFQRAIDNFVNAVLRRLDALGHPDTDLAGLWTVLSEDRSDPAAERKRRLEAQLGFDPEECPDATMAQAMEFQNRLGDAAMSELAPVYGRNEKDAMLAGIAELFTLHGLQGQMQLPLLNTGDQHSGRLPWQEGVDAARHLRMHIGNQKEPITDATLHALLGFGNKQAVQWSAGSRHPAAVARPIDGRQGAFEFIPRKRHPLARRLEFSRFIGDYLRGVTGGNQWLASTDLSTSRQKYQRAFAAEFLCPIDALMEFLDEDFSEPALEEAAEQFGVSEQTVGSLLMNNGYLRPPFQGFELPYPLAA